MTEDAVTLQRAVQVGQFGPMQLEGCVVDDHAGIAFADWADVEAALGVND
ncbi:hypothetical protein [Henriciella barbarensis]|nr:hypothetical protein [Henriciella barbarensis]